MSMFLLQVTLPWSEEEAEALLEIGGFEARYSRDLAEIQPRSSRDTAETQPRDGRDTAGR